MNIGTDIIEIERIRAAYAKHGSSFLNRLFTPSEQKYCAQYRDMPPRLAGRFAAKEAVVKALGVGECQWTEIEVLNDSKGKPEVTLTGKLKEQFTKYQISISISHCKEYATATAIMFGG
ncbi:MAG: Holo-[acyl-carrier-protein] synthase [Chlamydiales bacterium]|nr:Holo-[acyl-carrier-protein] synthase [Chlamydiales bacterium]MCH9620107.1 Holo-[acyl-carrier-protein] synthase [Chlamydiales bacterium]MCH9623577.1 Holo-[acyl-carrier-protein] synthase [Chlamydiales bacterium]